MRKSALGYNREFWGEPAERVFKKNRPEYHFLHSTAP